MSAKVSTIRYGKDGPTGDFDDNWLPVFGGEVITAYDEYNQFLDKVDFQTITSGNELEFPKVWKIGSEYHEAGVEMLGMDVETGKRIITLDDRPLVSHFTTDDIDELMSHYEMRSKFSKQVGIALSRTQDVNAVSLILNASREAAVNSFPSGTDSDTRATLGHADLLTIGRAGAVATLNAIEDALIYREENDVLNENVHCAVYPGQWYAIKNLGFPQTATEVGNGLTPVFAHNDFNPMAPGIIEGGDWRKPLIFNGVQIWKTNHLPGTVSGGTITGTNINTGPTRYQGDFSTTAGCIWSPEAIGVLVMMGLNTEQTRLTTRGLDFFVAKMLTGGGTMRPEAAYELKAS